MRPRFGVLTRAISGAFVLAGLGAVIAALGSLVRPLDVILLVFLGCIFLALGVGVWLEQTAAWCVGAAMAALSVVAGALLGGPWLVWSGVVVLFVVTGVQGWRDQGAGSTLNQRR